MPPLPSNIHVTSCLATDATELSTVQLEALSPFQINKIFAALFSHKPSEFVPISIAAGLSKPSSRFFKAVLRTTKQDGVIQESIVAFANWQLLSGNRADGGLLPPGGPLRPGEGLEEADAKSTSTETSKPGGEPAVMVPPPLEAGETKDEIDPSIFEPRPHLAEILKDFDSRRNREMRLCYIRNMEGRRHIYLKNLFVLSEYQRMGIGSELLKWGMEYGKKERVPVWLSSSEMGHPLYKRAGFEELGGWEVDLGVWGKRIEERERELDVKDGKGEGLGKELEGEMDWEWCMVKWPQQG